MNPKKRTEGERYLEKFLKSKNIKFEAEKMIEGLGNDYKPFRRADFYLPNYNVFIEFQGQWNREDKKQFYRDKKQVYKDNNIPCIYIYPENLGIIDYLFHERMLAVLKEHGMNKELRKYKLWRFVTERKSRLIWFFILLYYTIVGYKHATPDSINETIYFFVVVTLITITVLLGSDFNQYFVKEK